MKRLVISSVAAVCLALAASAAFTQQKDERAGNCADAKSQMEYFCDTSRGAGDTMVAVGTACENAKKNVAAACEGKVEEDKVYKFDK